MDGIVLIFLVGPLVVVPLGYGLIEVAAPDASPLPVARGALVVAAILLALSFGLQPGLAVLFAIPWLVLTGMGAIVAAVWLARSPERWRPSPRHAVVAALGFLAVGAVFAVADRLGVRPFGFSAPVIRLTAVHFLYAGFALPLAGALAYTRRPRRWIEVATGAVVVGIPTTALGFFGFPVANWIGAVLTAGGGFAIGLAMIGIAKTLATRWARVLGGIAGMSLLLSMPLAVVYATATLVGSTWLSIGWMVAVHGTLNALGFALAMVVAWTLDRRATQPAPIIVPRPAMPATRRWVIGFVTGLTVGIGVLVTGTLGAILGIVALLLLAIEPGREAPVGGLFIGGGIGWLALLGTASARCGPGCTIPDLTPWLAIAIGMLVIGLVLTWIATHRRSRAATTAR